MLVQVPGVAAVVGSVHVVTLLQLIGAILLSIGVWVLIIKQDYDSIHDILTSPSVLAVAVGAVMVVTALLGIIAAAASKLWPLRVVCCHLIKPTLFIYCIH